MVTYAQEHILKNKTIFFAELFSLGRAFNICEYVFISKKINDETLISMVVVLLCLLHETCEIYKRIYPGQSMINQSSCSLIWAKGKSIESAEDGYRFENILLPQPFEGFYISSACYFLNESSWDTDLGTFKKNLTSISNSSEINHEQFYLVYKGCNLPTVRFCFNPLNAFNNHN
jgi:hypothetical protein